jgi:hypothetical protein
MTGDETDFANDRFAVAMVGPGNATASILRNQRQVVDACSTSAASLLDF